MKISAAEIALAIATGQREALRLLLASGRADADAVHRGATPLSRAVCGADAAAVRLLLDAGADPDLRSHAGNGRIEPPLFTACRLRADDLVDLLIDAGADVNATDFYGHTPLWVATKGQRPLLVAKLLRWGARVGCDPSRADEWNWARCPLYLATKYLGYRGRHQLARFLLAAGCDPTKTDNEDRCSLYWTLRNADYDLFRFMIETHNPSCWPALNHRHGCQLIAQLPPEQVLIVAMEVVFVHGQLHRLPSLASQCRTVVRQRLLATGGHRSLYERVPRLPLPPRLQRFLLFDVEEPQQQLVPCYMK